MTRALMLAAALVVAATTSANAHQRLVRSTPADGARLETAPLALRLVFSQPAQLAVTVIELVDARGRRHPLGAARTAPDSSHIIVADVIGGLPPGTWTVRWQTAGPDGHVVSGALSFELAGDTAAADTAAADTATAAGFVPAARRESVWTRPGSFPLWLLRTLMLGGLLAVIGAVAFRFLVLGAIADPALVGFVDAASRRAAGLAAVAAALLLAVALVRLWAQAHALPAGATPAGMLSLVRSGSWGFAWLLHAAAALAALVAFASARRRTRAWWAAAAAAVVLALTPALSGHALGAPRLVALNVAADWLHVLGASGWLGSLLAVATAGMATAALGGAERHAAVRALIHAFSPTALAFAAVVVVSGVVLAWLRVGSLRELWFSNYGGVLLWKLAALLPVLAAGAYNWRKLRPALGTERATLRLKSSLRLELVSALVVLALTAALIATPPPVD